MGSSSKRFRSSSSKRSDSSWWLTHTYSSIGSISGSLLHKFSKSFYNFSFFLFGCTFNMVLDLILNSYRFGARCPLFSPATHRFFSYCSSWFLSSFITCASPPTSSTFESKSCSTYPFSSAIQPAEIFHFTASLCCTTNFSNQSRTVLSLECDTLVTLDKNSGVAGYIVNR